MALDPRKLNPALARPFVLQMDALITAAAAITQPLVQRVVSTHKFVITSIAPSYSVDAAAAVTPQIELYNMSTMQLRLTERGSNIPILENVTMDSFYDMLGGVNELDLKIPVVLNPGADLQLVLNFTDAGVIYAASAVTVNENVGLLLKGNLVAPE